MTAKSLTVALLLGSLVAGTAIYSERVMLRNKKQERITVIYWEKWTGGEGDEISRIVDWYNKSQDKVFVKILSIAGVQDKTMLAASGGNPPDIAGIWDHGVAMNTDVGALMDLTEMAKENGITEDQYIPVYWDPCTINGRLYALPSTPSTTALHVNRAQMPEKFKDPANAPKTIEELDALVDQISIREKDGKIKLAGFLPGEPGWWNYGWGNIFGGRLFDGKKFTIDCPENIAAFEWVRSYAKKFGVQSIQNFQSGFGNFSSPQNPFLSGKVSMEIQGVWTANYIEMYNPKFDWYAVPFPHPANRPDLKDNAFAGMDVLVIPKGARHPKEAFDFIKFVQRQDVMESLCKGHGKNSPLVKVSEDFFRTHKNKHIRLFDSLARSKSAFAVPKTGIWPVVTQEMGNVNTLVMLGTKTPKEALTDAQNRISKIWERYQEQMMRKQK